MGHNVDARGLSREIITIARDFNRGGLSVGTSGNLSARHARGFCITPSAVACHALAPEDIEKFKTYGKRPRPRGREPGGYGPPRRLVPDAALPPCLPHAGMGIGKNTDYKGCPSASIASLSFQRRLESRRGCRGVRISSDFKSSRGRLMGCHSRLGGNGLNQPLDSGLRRNDRG